MNTPSPLIDMGARIRTRRLALGLSQETLAYAVGYKSRTSINKIELGKTDLSQSMIKKIAEALKTTPSYILDGNTEDNPPEDEIISLTDEAKKLATDYDKLDSYGRKAVRAVTDAELQRVQAVVPIAEARKYKTVPLFANSFAAGPAEPDFGNLWTDYDVPADSRAEFAIRVNGNSMEPDLPDGSIALGVKRDPKDGEVGAFLLDGEFLVKHYCSDHRGDIFLFSLNRDRTDADVQLITGQEHTLLCFGTIITPKRPLPKI